MRKQIGSRNLLSDAGSSDWGSMTTRRGGVGRGEVQDGWDMHTPMADSC